jgi:hypothetical protein
VQCVICLLLYTTLHVNIRGGLLISDKKNPSEFKEFRPINMIHGICCYLIFNSCFDKFSKKKKERTCGDNIEHQC